MRHTLWQSFQYAARGLQTAFWSQRTMRIHLGLAGLVILLAAWLHLPIGETAVMILCMVAVLTAELLNTAIEAVVDLQVGQNHHDLAGRAKDLSAAAVLVTAVGAAIVGTFVLAPRLVEAVGLGRLDVVAAARAATLIAVLTLAVVVLRRPEDRGSARKPRA